jgi:hypothetical protein
VARSTGTSTAGPDAPAAAPGAHRLHQAAATKLILKIVGDLVLVPEYKEEVEKAGGQDMIREALNHSDRCAPGRSCEGVEPVGSVRLGVYPVAPFSPAVALGGLCARCSALVLPSVAPCTACCWWALRSRHQHASRGHAAWGVMVCSTLIAVHA